MSISRKTLKQAVFQCYLRRTPFGWGPHDLAEVLIQAALLAGCDLRREPSLAEVKRLMVDALRLMCFVSGCRHVNINGAGLVQHRGDDDDLLTEEWEQEESDGGRPMNILFVEDSVPFARITMAALNKGEIQHELTWLQDGAEALACIRRTGQFAAALRPDLILLDLELPNVSGQELLAEIRSQSELCDVPVVVMTVSDSVSDRRICEEWDVADYLIKPVDLEAFLGLVRDLRCRWPDEIILPAGDGSWEI